VDDLDKFVRLTDSPVWAAIYEAAQGPDDELKRLARPFVDRTHFRLAFELLLADNQESTATREAVANVWRAFALQIRQLAAHAVGADQAVAALQRDFGPMLQRRNPRRWDRARFDNLVEAVNNNVSSKFGPVRCDQTRQNAAKFFDPKNQIWVLLNGKTRYLDELSEIVSGMPDRIWRGRIYAPEHMRQDVKRFCEQWLAENRPSRGASDVPDES